MHYIMSHYAVDFIVVMAASVHIPVKAREVAARDLDPDSMACVKVIAGSHWREDYLVYFAGFHPNLLVVPVSIPHPLYGLVEIVGPPVRIDVDELDREVGILDVRGDIQGDLDRAADFDTFFEWLGAVDEYVGTSLHFALVKRSALDSIAGTADISAV